LVASELAVEDAGRVVEGGAVHEPELDLLEDVPDDEDAVELSDGCPHPFPLFGYPRVDAQDDPARVSKNSPAPVRVRSDQGIDLIVRNHAYFLRQLETDLAQTALTGTSLWKCPFSCHEA
jgi:hypothetical protein